jgi:hypothetical protein
MSQIIACRTNAGVILAADSLAFDMDVKNEVVERKINRLLQLTPNSAIVAGGAAEGESMCRALKEFIQEEDLSDVNAVYRAALPFLASEYEKFMRKKCEFLPLDPVHQIHFILGGYAPRDSRNPFRLYLIWTRLKLPQLDGDEIASIYTVPRLMRLEYKLHRMIQTGSSPETILDEARTSLDAQAKSHDEIAGPFSFAIISRHGFEEIQ